VIHGGSRERFAGQEVVQVVDERCHLTTRDRGAGTVRTVGEAAGDARLVEPADGRLLIGGLRGVVGEVGGAVIRRQLLDVVAHLEAIGLVGEPGEEQRHLAPLRRGVGPVGAVGEADGDLGGDQADDVPEGGIG
jgi:hypothetical protein